MAIAEAEAAALWPLLLATLRDAVPPPVRRHLANIYKADGPEDGNQSSLFCAFWVPYNTYLLKTSRSRRGGAAERRMAEAVAACVVRALKVFSDPRALLSVIDDAEKLVWWRSMSSDRGELPPHPVIDGAGRLDKRAMLAQLSV